jgi:hypothetical protein
VDHGSEINSLNRATWQTSDRTAEYAEAAYLFEAERLLLERIGPATRGGRILELG